MKSHHAFQNVFAQMCVTQTTQWHAEDLTFILEKYADGKVIVYGPPSYLEDIGVRRVVITFGKSVVEYHKDIQRGDYPTPKKIVVLDNDSMVLGGVAIHPILTACKTGNQVYEFIAMSTGELLGSGGYGNYLDSTVVKWFYPDVDYPISYDNYIPLEVHEYIQGLVDKNNAVEYSPVL